MKDSILELAAKGHEVEVEGIFYHMGENDMSFHPYRKEAAARVQAIIEQSRKDLKRPRLRWFVSQQPPTDDKRVNNIDVTAELEKVVATDDNLIHIKAFNLPEQEKKLVITTEGILHLGKSIADFYLAQ